MSQMMFDAVMLLGWLGKQGNQEER